MILLLCFEAVAVSAPAGEHPRSRRLHHGFAHTLLLRLVLEPFSTSFQWIMQPLRGLILAALPTLRRDRLVLRRQRCHYSHRLEAVKPLFETRCSKLEKTPG